MEKVYSTIKSLNIVAVCLFSILLLNSCAPAGKTIIKSEDVAVFAPPVYTGKDFNGYVNDVNWYMVYMFSYTQVLNDYALQHGWTPPLMPPICKYVDIPILKPVPQFQPKGNFRGNEFERELATYAKNLNRLMRDQVNSVNTSQDFQKKYMCIY